MTNEKKLTNLELFLLAEAPFLKDTLFDTNGAPITSKSLKILPFDLAFMVAKLCALKKGECYFTITDHLDWKKIRVWTDKPKERLYDYHDRKQPSAAGNSEIFLCEGFGSPANKFLYDQTRAGIEKLESTTADYYKMTKEYFR